MLFDAVDCRDCEAGSYADKFLLFLKRFPEAIGARAPRGARLRALPASARRTVAKRAAAAGRYPLASLSMPKCRDMTRSGQSISISAAVGSPARSRRERKVRRSVRANTRRD